MEIKNKIMPITEEEFKTNVKIRFNNILQGFDEYKHSNLTSMENKKMELRENDFINFMEAAFQLNFKDNNSGLLIDFYINNLSEEEESNIYNALEEKEKIVFKEILMLKSYNTNYFRILDKRLIGFFTKLSTREIFFITYYFISKPITIWGNYNLTFPLFYNEDYDLEKYKKIIRDNNLYI